MPTLPQLLTTKLSAPIAHPDLAPRPRLLVRLTEGLTGQLCDALTGHTGGQRMFEMLEKRDLFLIALDSERHWHRYHQLFADVLHLWLQQTNPGIIPHLHAHAADWYERQVIDAVEGNKEDKEQNEEPPSELHPK